MGLLVPTLAGALVGEGIFLAVCLMDQTAKKFLASATRAEFAPQEPSS
jgi:Tfp pilus assembly protein PilZ